MQTVFVAAVLRTYFV